MRNVLVATSCLLLMASAPVAASVSADNVRHVQAEKSDNSSLEAQWAWQIGVADYQDDLVAAASALPNYSGGAVDTVAHTLVLMGKGPPSAAVESLMAAAPPNVAVSWQQVSFSKSQLESAAAQLPSDVAVWETRYAPDYSGITAIYRPTSAATRIELPSSIETVPVTWIASSHPTIVPLDGRANGSAPFHGGSRIVRPNGFGCSTGTKVKKSNGDLVMLTAYHCNFVDGNLDSGGVEGIPWSLAGDGTAIGMSGGLKSRLWDVQAIDGKTYDKNVWVGGAINNSTLNSVTIGAGSLMKNNLVTLSGGYSGSAPTKVYDPDVDNVRYCFDNSNSFCDEHNNFVGVRDFDANGDPIAGQGDSGGPALQSAGGTDWKFAGIIVYGVPGYQTETCNGIQNRQCYSDPFPALDAV